MKLTSQTLGPARILLAGPPQARKTSVCGLLPKPLFFDFDGKLASIPKNYPDVDVEFEDFSSGPVSERLSKLNTFLKTGLANSDRQCLVLDSLTTFSVAVINYLMAKAPGKVNIAGKSCMEMQHWGVFNQLVLEVLHSLFDSEKHVVVICHLNTVQDDDSSVYEEIALGGQLKSTLPGLFTDFVKIEPKPDGDSLAYRALARPTKRICLGSSRLGFDKDSNGNLLPLNLASKKNIEKLWMPLVSKNAE